MRSGAAHLHRTCRNSAPDTIFMSSRERNYRPMREARKVTTRAIQRPVYKGPGEPPAGMPELTSGEISRFGGRPVQTIEVTGDWVLLLVLSSRQIQSGLLVRWKNYVWRVRSCEEIDGCLVAVVEAWGRTILESAKLSSYA